jgi:hypothetical protein
MHRRVVVAFPDLHHQAGSHGMTRHSLVVAFVVCTLALVLAPGRAEAQPEPFVIVGGGVGPTGLPLPDEPPRSHWSVGRATALGEYSGEGYVETETATFNADGTITGTFGSAGPYLFTAEDGDVLACYYGQTAFGATTPGTFTLVPQPELGAGIYIAYFVAQFVPYQPECTGKFAGVSGGWTMYAMTGPFVLGSSDPLYYVWHGVGTLTYAR